MINHNVQKNLEEFLFSQNDKGFKATWYRKSKATMTLKQENFQWQIFYVLIESFVKREEKIVSRKQYFWCELCRLIRHSLQRMHESLDRSSTTYKIKHLDLYCSQCNIIRFGKNKVHLFDQISRVKWAIWHVLKVDMFDLRTHDDFQATTQVSSS